MAHYASDAAGIGGQLRERPADFRVRELEAVDTEPIDADPDDFPHLVVRVTLRDWDTNDFVRRLSNELQVSRERIGWAGTKDKRAVTTQLFSLDRVDPAALPEIAGADLELVGRAGRSLYFGDLAGNAFEIRVTDVEDPDPAGALAAVTADLQSFLGEPADGSIGVPNYFGLQRFGSRRPITHAVGLAIVRGDWEDAVMTYLADAFETEPERTREAREFVGETRDWQRALERFPNGLGYERSMLHALVERGGTEPADFRDALEELPNNLQRLFVHAAQSLAFNRIVSERLDRGLSLHEPVAGDTVCFATIDPPGDEDPADLVVPDTDRLQAVTDGRVASVTRHCDRGRAFVTAPLVGTDTTLADGEPGEIERSVLGELELSPADFDLPDPYRSSGTRRAMLVRTAVDAEVEPEGHAVTFEFALPRGAYATVLLREYLKGAPLARS
jgi:tRNA pseudouridine13 synthase